MSRWTVNDDDLIVTVGQDVAFQFWITDHRGQPVPIAEPARMCVRDRLGMILFETSGPYTGTPDPLQDPILMVSDVNGMVQVTLPRGLTSRWTPDRHRYDVWATVVDADNIALFPEGQQAPMAAGTFIIRTRTTVMEDL